MARITFGPMIVDCRGSVGDTTFSSWKGINYIRSRVTPANPNTVAQQNQRNKLKYSVFQWQQLATDIKTRWNEYASPYSRSGYNFWCDNNIPAMAVADAVDLHYTPANKDLAGPTDFAAATGGSSGEINCTWSTGKTGALIYIEVIVFKASSTYYDIALEVKSHEAVLSSVGSVTISGLVAGQDYTVVANIIDTNLSKDKFSQSYCEVSIAAFI